MTASKRHYPHMMKAAYATLTKKTTGAGRQRVVNLIRDARHLPTLEICSAVWDTFLQELQTNDMPGDGIFGKGVSPMGGQNPAQETLRASRGRRHRIVLCSLLGWRTGHPARDCNWHARLGRIPLLLARFNTKPPRSPQRF